MSHLEESLERDIARISDKVRDMASLVDVALNDAMRSLTEGNRQLAYLVIVRDQRIDEIEKELDRLTLEFIVRQQPVARHLRFAYAAIKVNAELERLGDYAESIARQVLALSDMEFELPPDLFTEIGGCAIPMVRGAVDAFRLQDPDLARATVAAEEKADRLRHQLSRELVRLFQAGILPPEAVPPLQNITNRLERVADQAKNICQDVLYLCTGEYAKHIGSEVFRVLFIDADNASASQMAEALGNALQQPKFIFSSAGLEAGPLDAPTVAFMRAKGHNLGRQHPKSVEQVPNLGHYQIFVALTKEAQRVFPPAPTKAVCLDWSPSRSARQSGPPEDALERTYGFLKANITDLVEAIIHDQTR